MIEREGGRGLTLVTEATDFWGLAKDGEKG